QKDIQRIIARRFVVVKKSPSWSPCRKCSVCNKCMHGPCGVHSDETDKRFRDNDIMYACTCHGCAAETTSKVVNRRESKIPARASATEAGKAGKKRSHYDDSS
ncbi:MAG: hypothetical protein ACREBR_02040, partial [bacterium]